MVGFLNQKCSSFFGRPSSEHLPNPTGKSVNVSNFRRERRVDAANFFVEETLNINNFQIILVIVIFLSTLAVGTL
jgi:hypothetical protein